MGRGVIQLGWEAEWGWGAEGTEARSQRPLGAIRGLYSEDSGQLLKGFGPLPFPPWTLSGAP